MKNLIIIGAGGLGREVYDQALDNPDHLNEWQVKGFLDDRPNILDATPRNRPILGSAFDYIPVEGDVFITAIMDHRAREKYTRPILDRGGEFINLIHPSSRFAPSVQFGVGNILCWSVLISGDVKIGNHCIFNSMASIGHDAVLGDYVSIHNRALISGRSQLHDHCEIGGNATVLAGAVVETDARVGAGSVLLKRAPAGKMMMGVPAKVFDF